MTSEEKKKLYCRQCKQITNHTILNKVNIHDKNKFVWFNTDYFTLQCKGCETVCLLEEYCFSDDYDPETGESEITQTIYPDPYTNRSSMDDIHYLPKIIRKIYSETIIAFNKKLPILTSIGIRAVIEALCVDKKIEGSSLQKRIDKLAENGLMTKTEAELLHLTRFMGNAAAHELQEPIIDELTAGLDIIESSLRNAYILPQKAENLNRYKKDKNY